MGPTLTPQRSPRTGSVRKVNPSDLTRTVLWPSQAAKSPTSGQFLGLGTKGAGSMARIGGRRCRQ